MSLKQLLSVEGKTVLITGGSRGLGLQIAEGFGEMGAHVVLSARKAGELEEAAAHLKTLGIEARTIVNDLVQYDTLPELVAQAKGWKGQIDVLVNNAGAAWGAPAEDHSAEAWHKIVDLNLNALFRLTQIVARECMIPRREGKIINISSIAGLRSIMPRATRKSTVAYDASKAAVIALTRSLATEWGRYNINVNGIAPGPFPSGMNRLGNEWEAELKAAIPLGRVGGPEDLKGAAVFLASEASRFVQGHTIVVDGGRTIC
ncbi:MAG: SDR family oxidoreductase [Cupriavidus necator]